MEAATNSADGEDFYQNQTESNNYNVPSIQRINKANNILPIWKNADTMNLNHLILENIHLSPYFKNKLYTLKTYHEVIDEIYYNVSHLEPWEKGTHKTAGQTGMCGGVRGVGAGGVVSTPFCILFKLFTMRLTRKQLVGMINHTDSPYIRALGFMYIRFCQPPETFWEWYEPYFDDEEEIDPKAAGGDNMSMGQFVKLLLTKLDWYGTLFPRIPVPVQKDINEKLRQYNLKKFEDAKKEREAQESEKSKTEVESSRGDTRRSPGKHDSRRRDRSRDRTGSRRERSRSKESHSRSKRSKHRSHSRSRRRGSRHRSRSPRSSKTRAGDRRSVEKRGRSRSKSRDSKRHRSGSRHEHKKHKHRHHRSHRHRHRDHRDSKKANDGKTGRRSKSPAEKAGSREAVIRETDQSKEGSVNRSASPNEKPISSDSGVSADVQEKTRPNNEKIDEQVEEGELIEESTNANN